jgi:hypothetical protein
VATRQATTPAKAAAAGLQARGITLARLGARSSRIGTRVGLRPRAHDRHGLAMRYSATGLPRGLRINPRTGLISGRPKHSGTRRVTVRVTNGDGGLARTSFPWRIRTVRHHA